MSEQLAGGWTLEKLKARSPEERFNVWRNARRLNTPEGNALAHLIETCGEPYAEQGGISMSDPRVLEMRDIIESPEGRSACVEAAAAGHAALAGVEPLIREKMGDRYGAFSQMTVTAGSIVGALMHGLGYEKSGVRNMPPGSVAQSAAYWISKKP